MTLPSPRPISFHWFGQDICVDAGGAELLPLRGLALESPPVGASPPARRYRVRLRGTSAPVLESPGGPRALDPDLAEVHAANLILEDLFSTLGEQFALHATTVARDGRALMISGPSTFGKTTLGLSLVERGFELVCDDVSFLGRGDGAVAPFGKSLRLRPEARRRLGPARLEAARRSTFAEQDGDWLVRARDWVTIARRPARPRLVVVLHPPQSGDGVRRLPRYEVRAMRGREEILEALHGLAGVRRWNRDPEVPSRAWVTCDDAAPLARWLDEHRQDLVYATKAPEAAPDFRSSPQGRSITRFQAALELAQEMLNRQPGSVLAREFEGREPELVAELAGLLGGARCKALIPGRLEESVALLERWFEEACRP